MEHVIVKFTHSGEEMLEWLKTTKDGDLFDYDLLRHESTFFLCAVKTDFGPIAYLPVQQPLMLESLAAKPGLGPRDTALALTRMVEYAIGEAFRRDAGELYFLTRDKETADFARRHRFTPLPDGLEVYRLNLRETFGIS